MRQLLHASSVIVTCLCLAACESPPPEREVAPLEEMPTYEGRTVEEWMDVLREPASGSRMNASVALTALTPWSITPLAEELDAEDPGLRYAAALSLANMGPAAQPADAALVPCLSDPEPRVRDVAARAVGNFGQGGTRSVPHLARLLRDEDRRVRLHAAEALRKLRVTDGAVMATMRDVMLHDRDPEVRRVARAAWTGNAENRHVDTHGRAIDRGRATP